MAGEGGIRDGFAGRREEVEVIIFLCIQLAGDGREHNNLTKYLVRDRYVSERNRGHENKCL